jgi:hypothetical protein
MDLAFYVLIAYAALTLAYAVIIRSSSVNKLRLAAWLEASARAQEEMWQAKRGIEEEQRLYQRTRELALLRGEREKTRNIEIASR